MQSLLDHGWPQESLAFMDGMSLDEMKGFLGSWAQDWELEQFEEVRQESKRQKKLLDMEDRAYARNPVMFQKDSAWKNRTGHADLSDSSRGVELAQVRPLLPRAVWPTRFARRFADGKDEHQRSKVEERERERLTQQLVALLKKAGLLKVDEKVEEGQAKQWLEKRHAMGRRTNTLRQHLRLGRKLSSYMRNAYGRPWFRSAGDVMEYVALHLEEPCGKTVPHPCGRPFGSWRSRLRSRSQVGSPQTWLYRISLVRWTDIPLGQRSTTERAPIVWCCLWWWHGR